MPGIQKLTELDMIAYVLFTTKIHTSGFSDNCFKCSSVVYHPRKIGVNEMSAGRTQTLANIKQTVLLVMFKGYSSGRTIA